MNLRLLAMASIVALGAVSGMASAATVRFDSTECPTCSSPTPPPLGAWSAYGLSVSDAYWYIDSRDTFDTMGLSIDHSPATISFTTASTGVSIDWWVIGGFTGTYNAYDSGGGLLGSLFVDASATGDQLGSYGFSGSVKSIQWSGSPGFAQISTVNFTAAPVPEPETYAMMLAGLALLAGLSRRGRKA